jgi:hypothetical protein
MTNYFIKPLTINVLYQHISTSYYQLIPNAFLEKNF